MSEEMWNNEENLLKFDEEAFQIIKKKSSPKIINKTTVYFSTASEMSHSNSQALCSEAILEIRQTADVLHGQISTSKQMLLSSELVYSWTFLSFLIMRGARIVGKSLRKTFPSTFPHPKWIIYTYLIRLDLKAERGHRPTWTKRLKTD